MVWSETLMPERSDCVHLATNCLGKSSVLAEHYAVHVTQLQRIKIFPREAKTRYLRYDHSIFWTLPSNDSRQMRPVLMESSISFMYRKLTANTMYAV